MHTQITDDSIRPLVSGARALGGGPLLKGDVVRLVYLDEGGISQYEPILVVAGVLLHADKQLIPVEDYLEELRKKHIPAEDQPNFVFHATEIFSGTKYFKDRDRWPWEKRSKILADLAAIPRQFGLPITWGFVKKDSFPSFELEENPSVKNRENLAYIVALLQCTLSVERTMRWLWPNEVAILIAEDRDKIRGAIKTFHAIYRNPQAILEMGARADELPLTRIRDTVHFAKKSESAHLQLADVCTFLIKGHLLRHHLNPPFYDLLAEMMIAMPMDGAKVQSA